MRAYEFITDIFNCEVYEPVQMVMERFDDSLWLYNNIKNTIDNYSYQNFTNKNFYSTILRNIIADDKFIIIFRDLKHVPIFYYIEEYGSNIISAKTSYNTTNISIKGITLTLLVPYTKLNKKKLLAELDSVIGHEINHMIQKIKHYRNNHLGPKSNRHSDLIKFANDNLFAPYLIQHRDMLNYYYLNSKELDSHAYTYGIRLWHQFEYDSKKVLQLLSNVIWKDNFNSSIGVKHNGITIDRETVMGLDQFATSFKKADSYGILKDNISGYDLWKKIISEIYKYIDSRMSL
jgi:hypothetical protein